MTDCRNQDVVLSNCFSLQTNSGHSVAPLMNTLSPIVLVVSDVSRKQSGLSGVLNCLSRKNSVREYILYFKYFNI